ncbi:MAG TPA: helix-turn-helix transcriptional regulator [Allocoleopsis sp.]
MQSKKLYQYDLLISKEQNELNAKAFEQSLPVNPLQYKHQDPEPQLSQREFEIMDMTLKGMEIPDISLKIFLTVAGVKYRLSCIYEKFGVKNRLQLINKAAKTGLQFRLPSGIKQTFHLNLDMAAHLSQKKDDNEHS